MIPVRRLNNDLIMINSDMIEHIEANPDTVVSFVDGNKMIVRDTMEEIREKIIEFKRNIYGPNAPLP